MLWRGKVEERVTYGSLFLSFWEPIHFQLCDQSRRKASSGVSGKVTLSPRLPVLTVTGPEIYPRAMQRPLLPQHQDKKVALRGQMGSFLPELSRHEESPTNTMARKESLSGSKCPQGNHWYQNALENLLNWRPMTVSFKLSRLLWAGLIQTPCSARLWLRHLSQGPKQAGCSDFQRPEEPSCQLAHQMAVPCLRKYLISH